MTEETNDRFLVGYFCGVLLMLTVAVLMARRRQSAATVTIVRKFACRECGEVLPRSEEYTCADWSDKTMRDRMCKRCMFLFSEQQQRSRQNGGAESDKYPGE